MLAFTLSLDDYVITYFTAGPGSTTLPLRVFSMVRFMVTPEVNALSTIWVLVVFAVLLIGQHRSKSQSLGHQEPDKGGRNEIESARQCCCCPLILLLAACAPKAPAGGSASDLHRAEPVCLERIRAAAAAG